MTSELSNIFSSDVIKNIDITSLESVIHQIELYDPEKSKWKPLSNQVVVFCENYVYKVYVYNIQDIFLSKIRKELASIYQSYGIDWEVVTLISDQTVVDIERREYLDVLQEWNDDVLVGYSETLQALEKKLGIIDIPRQLCLDPDVHVKLVRNCINKGIDYAIFNGKVILLDDADFYLAFIKENGTVLSFKANSFISSTVKLNLADYIVIPQDYNFILKDQAQHVTDEVDKFFLAYQSKELTNYKETSLQLLDKRESMLKHNLDILLREDLKEINKNNVSNMCSNGTLEYILWNNCTNKCSFCPQCLKADQETHLNKEEMRNSIGAVFKAINNKPDGIHDILLVGGEILANYDDDISGCLCSLFLEVLDKIRKNKIRYLYINTNLLYTDLSNLDFLLKTFSNNGFADRLKFTTSYDLKGRFTTKEREDLFFNNLKYVETLYPKINTVVNVVMTKSTVEKYLNGSFSPEILESDYGVKYVSFLPYVPVSENDPESVDLKTIIKVLAKRERSNPGFIKFYIDDLDLNQKRTLFEYRKSSGLVECTAKMNDCYHNSNFTRILKDGKCFICALKDIFQ